MLIQNIETIAKGNSFKRELIKYWYKKLIRMLESWMHLICLQTGGYKKVGDSKICGCHFRGDHSFDQKSILPKPLTKKSIFFFFMICILTSELGKCSFDQESFSLKLLTKKTFLFFGVQMSCILFSDLGGHCHIKWNLKSILSKHQTRT